MPAATTTFTYDVAACNVYTMLTDTVGGSPTYGAAVKVPGIQHAGWDPTFVSVDLRGDSTLIAKKGRIDRFHGRFQYAKPSQLVNAVIFGGTVVPSGVDPASESRWSLYAPATLPYFKVEFLIQAVDNQAGLAEVQVILPKCQTTVATFMDQATDAFASPTFEVDAIQPSFAGTPMGYVRYLGQATGLSL